MKLKKGKQIVDYEKEVLMKERIRNAALKAAEVHDSFYLYDEQGILESAERLVSNFPNAEFIYSVKCNHDKRVLKTVFGQGYGADAAGLQEVLKCVECGLSKERIYYSAPGKTEYDIENAIDKCILIADSIEEIKTIDKIATEKNIKAKIGLRINPDFTFFADKGAPSKFGVDEDKALEFISNNSCTAVSITGIHVHLRSQELNPLTLVNYWKRMLTLAGKFTNALGCLEYVNMGSGIGIQYAITDKALNITELGSAIKSEFASFSSTYSNTKVIIETGRYVVCDNGWYFTKVLDRKESYGKTFIILKNTLNGFMRPSLAKLIMSYTTGENPKGTEPLFTSNNAFSFISLKESKNMETVSLVGNLCTPADIIEDDIMMPYLEKGDLVAVSNAGSYAAVLSPMQFSSQTKPSQLFLTKDGNIL